MKKIIAVLLLSVFLTACQGSKPTVPQNHTPDGNAVTPSGEIVVALDDVTEALALTKGYETVTVTRSGQVLTNPTAVENMSTHDNADGTKTYTFTLVNDLTFSDGTPVAAKDYIFSILAQNTHPELLSYKNEDGTLSSKGVRLLDTHKFSLTVRGDAIPHYYETLLTSVTPLPIATICPDATVADNSEGVVIANFNADALKAYLENPTVVSGAYTVESIGNEIVLKANPYFKGNYETQKPTIEKITAVPFTSSQKFDLLPDTTLELTGFKQTKHAEDDINTLFLSADLRDDKALTKVLKPYFDSGDAEILKIADYLLETAEYNQTEFLEKWDELEKKTPTTSLYDYSATHIRGYNNISSFWDWTDQILYCFIARE